MASLPLFGKIGLVLLALGGTATYLCLIAKCDGLIYYPLGACLIGFTLFYCAIRRKPADVRIEDGM